MASINYTIYEHSAEADEKLKNRDVLFIDNEIVRELLDIDDCLEALEDAFREEGAGAAANRSKSVMHIPSPASGAWHQYVSMEGGIRKLGVVALRLRSHIHVQRTLYGKRRHDFYSVVPGMWGGIVLLFSSEDGSLLAILNDGHIQHLRVAATGALSVKYLARKEAKVLSILGSGGMAVTHAWAISRVRKIERIQVYSPNREHRDRFAEQMTEDLGVEVVPLADPREAVRGSDIVAACTNSNQAVVEASWLETGMHVIAVNTSEIHEDEAVLRRFDRYVIYRSAPAEQLFTTPEDWRPESLGGSSPEWAERERRLVGPEKMAALPQIILGEAPGRVSENEITGFNSEGTGVQFAALAFLAYQRAKERGLGNKLPLRWFVQDIRS